MGPHLDRAGARPGLIRARRRQWDLAAGSSQEAHTRAEEGHDRGRLRQSGLQACCAGPGKRSGGACTGLRMNRLVAAGGDRGGDRQN
jgi:hypothetical protein